MPNQRPGFRARAANPRPSKQEAGRHRKGKIAGKGDIPRKHFLLLPSNMLMRPRSGTLSALSYFQVEPQSPTLDVPTPRSRSRWICFNSV